MSIVATTHIHTLASFARASLPYRPAQRQTRALSSKTANDGCRHISTAPMLDCFTLAAVQCTTAMPIPTRCKRTRPHRPAGDPNQTSMAHPRYNNDVQTPNTPRCTLPGERRRVRGREPRRERGFRWRYFSDRFTCMKLSAGDNSSCVAFRALAPEPHLLPSHCRSTYPPPLAELHFPLT